MHTWFECKVRYEKVAENGMNKKVREKKKYRYGSIDDPDDYRMDKYR